MAHEDHSAHHVNYLYVFGALCGFTLLSVLFDGLTDLVSSAVVIVLVLAVAVAKALCVMMFFMHLKFEGNWKFVLLAPTTILAIGLPLALMPDIGVSYYTTVAPQTIAWGEEMAEFHAEHGEHHEGEDAADHHSEESAGHADNHGSDDQSSSHDE